MLRTYIICPDTKLTDRLSAALKPLCDQVVVTGTLDAYPNAEDFERSIRQHSPDAIFVSFAEVARGVAITRFLEQQSTGIQVIAIHDSLETERLRESMRSGVREFLADPFDAGLVAEAVNRVEEWVTDHPPKHRSGQHLYSFLPAKAGVGATTLALNITSSLAEAMEPDGKGKALLSDLDLNSGMLRFLLKLDNPHSLADAIERAEDTDRQLWDQMVTSKGNLDILHAGAVNPNVRIDTLRMGRLFEFMQQNYAVACCDLSGNLERYAIAAMEESRQVFLVSTPEMPALQVAREKVEFLKSLGLEGRTALLLNRVGPDPVLSSSQIEEIVGLPVTCSFSNDYQAVTEAMADARLLDPGSRIGGQCSAFAYSLLGKEPVPAPQPKKGFLSFFTSMAGGSRGAGTPVVSQAAS